MTRFLLVCLFFPLCISAQKVDTIKVHSEVMNKNISCVVITPNNLKHSKAFPVVYLLHGYGGSYNNWITKVPLLKSYAEKFNLIIVCPDGTNSWYVNSVMDSSVRYETFITQELVKHIDRSYKTIKHKSGRAITGLSMGGHGALLLAMRHPEIFSAAGSMSGVVDLYGSSRKYDIVKLLGDTIKNALVWKSHSVLDLVDSVKTFPKMIIDCGVSDAFIIGNRKLHEKLVNAGVGHDYIERTGKHDWKYWSNAVLYHLIFFKEFFDGR